MISIKYLICLIFVDGMNILLALFKALFLIIFIFLYFSNHLFANAQTNPFLNEYSVDFIIFSENFFILSNKLLFWIEFAIMFG
jgi:hypothetical protein